MANLFTKESIKARMFKQAATLYDIRNIDGMDPLIRLLIEALSGEIFKLSGDMHAIESRLLEKVASALTPHTALVAKPAMLLLLPDHIHRKLLYLPQTCFLIKARR